MQRVASELDKPSDSASGHPSGTSAKVNHFQGVNIFCAILHTAGCKWQDWPWPTSQGTQQVLALSMACCHIKFLRWVSFCPEPSCKNHSVTYVCSWKPYGSTCSGFKPSVLRGNYGHVKLLHFCQPTSYLILAACALRNDRPRTADTCAHRWPGSHQKYHDWCNVASTGG